MKPEYSEQEIGREFSRQYPGYAIDIRQQVKPIAYFTSNVGPPSSEKATLTYSARVTTRHGQLVTSTPYLDSISDAIFWAEIALIAAVRPSEHQSASWRVIVTRRLPEHLQDRHWRCVRVSDQEREDSWPGDNWSVVLTDESSRVTGTGVTILIAVDDAIDQITL